MDTIVTKDYTYTVTDSGGETPAAEPFISVTVTDTIEDPNASHNFTIVNGHHLHVPTRRHRSDQHLPCWPQHTNLHPVHHRTGAPGGRRRHPA